MCCRPAHDSGKGHEQGLRILLSADIELTVEEGPGAVIHRLDYDRC